MVTSRARSWRRIAAFAYRALRRGLRPGYSVLPMIGLFAWLALACAFALFAARRLRPE